MTKINKIESSKSIKELLEFGFINIDKPAGPTSFAVGQFVKQKLQLRKTSHLGTLDPAVSGVLPIALNRACKLNEVFMHRDKEYIGIMRLHEDVSDEVLKKEINKFIGKITQMPPVRSRVKRAERIREVKKFEILERDGKDVLFLADVEAGTYIRKLIHDLGKNIGGAHMLELRRTKAGIFSEDDNNFVNLYEFEKAIEEFENGNEEKLKRMIISAEEATRKVLPIVKIKEISVKGLLTGKPLHKGDADISGIVEEKFAVFCNDRFIGIYRKADEGEIISRAEFVYN